MKIQRTLPPVAAPIAWRDLARGIAGIFSGKQKIKTLEAELQEYFHVKHVFLLSSGKAALTLILEALKSLSVRRHVLIPAYTCFSVPSAVVKTGLQVSLCDVDPRSLDFNFASLEASLNQDTLCVVPTHLLGLPSDVGRVKALCKERGTFVVEDAAQAMGVRYKDKLLGTLGDVALLSFGRGKNITSGSGGVILTNSDMIGEAIGGLYTKLREESWLGRLRNLVEVLGMYLFIDPRLYWLPAGIPFLKLGETKFSTDFETHRMDGIRAGLLSHWQERLQQANSARSATARCFMDCYSADGRAVQPMSAENTTYLRFPVLTDSKKTKERLCALSDQNGLGMSPLYPTSVAGIKELESSLKKQAIPGAERVADRLVTIPVHHLLQQRDRERILDTIDHANAVKSEERAWVRPWKQKPVLVLDGERATALAIVRSLGRKGLRVEVGSSVDRPLAAYSRYCRRSFVYPSPLLNAWSFQSVLLQELKTRPYAAVFPVTDLTIRPLMAIRDSVEQLCPIAMASNEALSIALSKSQTYELAGSLGIPVPKTLMIRNAEELLQLQEKLSYPVVIKADCSKTWDADGKGHDHSVAYARDFKECRFIVSKWLPVGVVILQEYVRGEGVGMAVLASKGEVLFAFQYRRLHEVPLTGGASSYRVSEKIDPELLGYASSLVEALVWDGVAMIEFKVDREEGKKHFMEMNGRFWGSLPLALAAGADFPSYFFDLFVHEKRECPRSYKVGVRCRDLSREMEWLKTALFNEWRTNELARVPSYRKIFTDSCRWLNPHESWDTFNWRDPSPGIKEFAGCIQQISRACRMKLWLLIEKKRMQRFQRKQKVLIEKIRQAKTILVVCQGNFIRSPFAAQVLAQTLPRNLRVTVRSAGLEADPGCPAHPHAVARARSLGIDLSTHSASRLTAEMVAMADLILAMELDHLRFIAKRFSGARRKTFLFGCFSTDGPLEIADPISKNEAVFDQCLNQILKAIEPIGLSLSGTTRR